MSDILVAQMRDKRRGGVADGLQGVSILCRSFVDGRDWDGGSRLTLSFRLYALRNWAINLINTSSPTCGSLVLTIETKAAKTGVNGSEDA